MSGPTKKFCLLTIGRAGSTSLMDALAAFPDIVVPNKNTPCPDHELTHQGRQHGFMERYSALVGRRIVDQRQLVNAFYRYNEGSPFVGFKTMPNRCTQAFLERADIQFITLVRRDVPSTLASFQTAFLAKTYDRRGGPQQRMRFDLERHARRLRETHRYVVAGTARLSVLPGAIHLVYEDLCDPAFESKELNAYFGRPIRLPAPRPPISGSSYVENWDEFIAFLESDPGPSPSSGPPTRNPRTEG